jgi:hypothetical protein
MRLSADRRAPARVTIRNYSKSIIRLATLLWIYQIAIPMIRILAPAIRRQAAMAAGAKENHAAAIRAVATHVVRTPVTVVAEVLVTGCSTALKHAGMRPTAGLLTTVATVSIGKTP